MNFGEIEALLLKYPHIQKVAVIKQTIQNREYISAYFVSSKKIIIPQIRNYLSHLLPRYMVPSYFVALSDFPYTPNGKIDKKALPLPKKILNVSKEEYVAPQSELERQLVSIWEKLLNNKPIGVNDNFFELGGDSLLAMNLNIELLKISDKITYSDIFRYPTISELAKKMDSNDDKPYFSKIENLSDNYVDILKNCTKKEKIKNWTPKNILLTGGTGFLGIHILEEWIKKESGNIYCIIREEPGITAKAKLYQKLNYYFGNKYDDLIDKRIFAITGSIAKPGFGLAQDELLKLADSVDVVINSAARVKHFGSYYAFYKSNVKSVKYIIDFCKSFDKKLYHISTLSVSSKTPDLSYLFYRKKRNTTIRYNESCLYAGQILDNVYERSKFEAESLVLDAVSKGLDGYILRMGNLMPRYKDGVFQENVLDNAFVHKFIAFIKIGVMPDYLYNQLIDFTPIDYAAQAVCKLITHPTNKNRIFHLYNHRNTSVSKCLKLLKKFDYNIEIIPEEDFKKKIKAILYDENSKKILNNLINDFDKNLHLNYTTDIMIESKFTIKYLRKIHFKWPKLTNEYLIRFINLLREVM